MMQPPPFFEIGARTNFSFLEGASRPEEMIRQASAIGLSGLGVADRNSVAGVVRVFNHRREMKEIHERQQREGVREDEEVMPFPCPFRPGARLVFSDETPDILAYPKNRKGWANLCRLLSRGNLRTQKGNCILEEWDILEWGEEMMLAVVPDPLRLEEDRYLQKLGDHLFRMRARFEKALFLTLSPTYDGREDFVFTTLSNFSSRYRLPLIGTNQPLFHHPDRRSLADVVTAIREHVPVAQAGFRLAANGERYLKPSFEMARLFRHYPQAVANAERFFSQLQFSLEELEHNYPDESIAGETLSETLERLTWEGAAERFEGDVPEKVAIQIRKELALIQQMKYEPYFLTVRHIVWHARHVLKILCQGRGSAANSTVCYCLGITEVNPEKSKLLFARFISTERNEPPDIDVDFEHERREEVIRYIYEHYGYRHAGLTAAVTSYRTRMAGREVAKAFDLSEDVQAALSSTVWGWSEEGLSEREAKFAGLDTGDSTTKRVMAHAKALIGFPRHLTQHVGGFLITRDRLDEVVPIMPTAMPGRYMIEWDKDDLDTLNLLKIDVLALGMLSCLKRAFSLMHRHYERDESLHSLMQKNDDQNVYDMICRADTIGVFQIESRAQMSMLPRLRPRVFYDLVIEVAIVRPGPIQGDMVHPYLKRREDERRGKKVVYEHPDLKDVLERTLGIPLFQEQAMQIAITAAGFSPDKADRLRRSMATFKRSGRVEEFKTDMTSGMLERGYSREFAERCFSQIQGFAEYGFPESHAASFALLVYGSSWIKTYYPDVFCAALLNSQPMGFYAPAQLIRDAREHGVKILPVDVNCSEWDCILESTSCDRTPIDKRHSSMRDVIRTRYAVRLGFRQIKGLGEKAVEKLIANRGAGYASVHDLWLRSGLDRSDVERLADADAFTSIDLNRREALWGVRGLDEKSSVERLPLFDAAGGRDLRREAEANLPEMLPGEEVIEDYRYLSLSLKAHPVSFLRGRMESMGIVRSVDLLRVPDGSRVTIAGLVLVRQRPGSAKGVIFMTLEDETGVANAIVWKKVFDTYRPIVMTARLVKIHGRLQSQSGVIHTVVDHIEDITPMLGLLQQKESIAPPHVGEPLNSDGQMRRIKTSDQEKRRHLLPKETEQFWPEPRPEAVMPRGRNFH